ncbi:MAG: Ig-like domain-containing protein [Oscillochloridaceae bacterium]|nr:Ig-like domain-containing protein [Chloroflexaceae bacterium]MDW8388834.1 Ig-like domain-containing protein [Oscillochloridaceae bacterium]
MITLLRLLARIWTVVLGGTALALWLALLARAAIPLTPFAPAPTVLAIEPPDQAADVLPRTSIAIRFSAPMNRAATAAALRISPATPGSLTWSPDATTLTFQPDTTLLPAVTYTVSLDERALGRWWRPLAQPVSVRFGTAPQPAVVAALPDGAGVAPDTSLAVVFSQPMVLPEAAGQPVEMPHLQFDPPFPATFRWLDQHTLQIRPMTPLAPATPYTVTIAPNLADLRGAELGAPFVWRFSTAWPEVIERAPADGARWVASRMPLTLRLAAAAPPEQIERALRIEPPVEGDLATAIISATQVVTFTPRSGWQPGISYTVRLADPLDEEGGMAPWSFTVAPEPRLEAFFPGQGQVIAPGQEIRLVFSSPMSEEALRAGLRFDPPVGEVAITISETEVRLRPELRPSTRYTMTLAAGTPDLAGSPLASDVVIGLRTAPAAPALTAPAAFDGIIVLPEKAPAAVELERTSLTALDLRLYALDEATLLLAAALRPDEREGFNPERYGQPLARSWRVELRDPSGVPARSRVPVGLSDGEALAPGAYFLRARSPEGPRADLLLLVSTVRLTLRVVGEQALVWATDSRSGAPLADLPVALYRGSTLLARGRTDADGLWVTTVAEGAGPLIATAGSDRPAVVRADWAPVTAATPAYRSLIFIDRPVYAPGDTLQMSGLTRRRDPGGLFVAPAPDAPCRMQLRPLAGGTESIPPATCAIEPVSGIARGTLTLPPDLEPGEYRLTTRIGDSASSVVLRVAPRDGAPVFVLAVFEEPGGLRIRLERNGLPLAGAALNWRLGLEPLGPPPTPPGYQLENIAAETVTLAGSGSADARGELRITFPARPSVATRYRLWVALAASGGESGVATEGMLAGGAPLVAVSLPERFIVSDRRGSVALLALDGLGRPVPGARVKIEVTRAGGSAPLLVRQAVTEADGRAGVQLPLLNPGHYQISASAGGPATTTELWVTGGRFANWGLPDGQMALIADRDRYRPGEVARLLVAIPEAESRLLLMIERGKLLETEVRNVRAGQVITLPITDEMTPGVNVSAVATAGDTWRWGSTTILVNADDPPTVALDAGATLQPPGATGVLTITASTGDLSSAENTLLTIAPAPEEEGAETFSVAGWLQRFQPELLPAPIAATLPQPAIRLSSAPRGVAIAAPGYAPPVEWLNDTPGSLKMPLPVTSGRWLVSALTASSTGPPAGASVVITTGLPLAYDLLAPAMLHPTDRAVIALDLRNAGIGRRQVRVRLNRSNLILERTAPVEQRLVLDEGARGRVAWRVRPEPGAAEASITLSIVTDGQRDVLERRIPIETASAPTLNGVTIPAVGPLDVTVERPATTDLLVVAIAPGVRAALEDQAERLAALTPRSVDEEACLALIAARLAREARGPERVRRAVLLREALRDLEAAQNEDGGWGWWPASPSRPFVTALVLEAQAAAYEALGDNRSPNRQAITYLSRAAPAADPDTRAYVAYALARAWHTDPGTLALLDEALSADGLAFLSLALPPEQAAPALDRLQALARRETTTAGQPDLVRWTADRPSGLPGGSVAVTAAAVQALRAGRPGASELPGAEWTLLAAWGIEGWPSPWDAARVAAALPTEAATAAGPRRVLLDGAPLLGDGAPITTTLRASSTPATPAPILRVEAGAAARYLVAYGVPRRTTDSAGQPALYLELADPATGAPLSDASLRPGQIVALRLTLVTARPLSRARVVVPLPAGLETLPGAPRSPLRQTAVFAEGRITLEAADLAPGVYNETIIARAIASGTYGASPARVTPVFAPELTAIAPAGVTITVGE